MAKTKDIDAATALVILWGTIKGALEEERQRAENAPGNKEIAGRMDAFSVTSRWIIRLAEQAKVDLTLPPI